MVTVAIYKDKDAQWKFLAGYFMDTCWKNLLGFIRAAARMLTSGKSSGNRKIVEKEDESYLPSMLFKIENPLILWHSPS